MSANILSDALAITGPDGDRRQHYGDAYQDCSRVAQFASILTGQDIRPEHVPLLMIAVKLSRQVHAPKRDNLVDIAGWARVAEMVDANAATRRDSDG